jgi:ribosome-binding protein aMBF1 (putative translation factor)
MNYCDICEKSVRGKTHKFVSEGYLLYLCNKHNKEMHRYVLKHVIRNIHNQYKM